MARSRRRTAPRDPLTQATPNWKWRTLPVWLALTGGVVIGWYIAAVGAGFKVENWAFYILLVFVAAFSFGLSRIVSWFTGRWVARRRAKSADKRILKDPASRR